MSTTAPDTNSVGGSVWAEPSKNAAVNIFKKFLFNRMRGAEENNNNLTVQAWESSKCGSQVERENWEHGETQSSSEVTSSVFSQSNLSISFFFLKKGTFSQDMSMDCNWHQQVCPSRLKWVYFSSVWKTTCAVHRVPHMEQEKTSYNNKQIINE